MKWWCVASSSVGWACRSCSWHWIIHSFKWYGDFVGKFLINPVIMKFPKSELFNRKFVEENQMEWLLLVRKFRNFVTEKFPKIQTVIFLWKESYPNLFFLVWCYVGHVTFSGHRRHSVMSRLLQKWRLKADADLLSTTNSIINLCYNMLQYNYLMLQYNYLKNICRKLGYIRSY